MQSEKLKQFTCPEAVILMVSVRKVTSNFKHIVVLNDPTRSNYNLIGLRSHLLGCKSYGRNYTTKCLKIRCSVTESGTLSYFTGVEYELVFIFLSLQRAASVDCALFHAICFAMPRRKRTCTKNCTRKQGRYLILGVIMLLSFCIKDGNESASNEESD